MLQEVNMKEFLQYVKEVMVEDFRAMFSPIMAMYRFMERHSKSSSEQ